MYQHKLYRAINTGLMVLGLAACATNGGDIATGPTFKDCQAYAIAQAENATSGDNAALYHAAAESLTYCAANADVNADQLDVMQSLALAIMNYFKAGDVASAQSVLGEFKQTYPGQDLFFADGSSFIDSAALLLGELPEQAAGRGSLVNAKADLKSEFRRLQYWQSH